MLQQMTKTVGGIWEVRNWGLSIIFLPENIHNLSFGRITLELVCLGFDYSVGLWFTFHVVSFILGLSRIKFMVLHIHIMNDLTEMSL